MTAGRRVVVADLLSMVVDRAQAWAIEDQDGGGDGAEWAGLALQAELLVVAVRMRG